MSQTASTDVNWYAQYQGYWGVRITFTLTGVLSDDRKTLQCTVGNLNYYTDPASSSGYGFINVAGVLWGSVDFTYSVYNDDSSAETWDEVLSEMAQGLPSIGWQTMFGVYCSDDSAHAVQGTYGNNYTFTFNSETPITGEYPILTSYTRSRVNATNQAVTTSADAPWEIDLSEVIDLPYYPGARRTGGVWVSLDESGLFRLKSGSWQDVTNYEKSTASNLGFRRESGAWATMPKQ